MSYVLSQRQENILDFIEKFLDDYQFPPTVRDIQSGCNISSTSVVDYNLQILQKEGYLNRLPDVSRGIELLENAYGESKKSIVKVPVLGFIAAGEPIEALENPEMVDIPSSLLHPDNYVLQVKGNSMIDEQIHDKDYIVARKTNTARSGQIVVALINGEATLKYYIHGPEGVELHPRNPDFPIIKVDPRVRLSVFIPCGEECSMFKEPT